MIPRALAARDLQPGARVAPEVEHGGAPAHAELVASISVSFSAERATYPRRFASLA